MKAVTFDSLFSAQTIQSSTKQKFCTSYKMNYFPYFYNMFCVHILKVTS